MSVPTDLIDYLNAQADVYNIAGPRVHYARMPEASRYPAIWFIRSGKDNEPDLDGQGGLALHRFDLEVLATDPDQMEELADAVETALAGHRGTFGTRTVQGVFIHDQADDYIPRAAAGDDGVFTSALELTIWTT